MKKYVYDLTFVAPSFKDFTGLGELAVLHGHYEEEGESLLSLLNKKFSPFGFCLKPLKWGESQSRIKATARVYKVRNFIGKKSGIYSVKKSRGYVYNIFPLKQAQEAPK